MNKKNRENKIKRDSFVKSYKTTNPDHTFIHTPLFQRAKSDKNSYPLLHNSNFDGEALGWSYLDFKSKSGQEVNLHYHNLDFEADLMSLKDVSEQLIKNNDKKIPNVVKNLLFHFYDHLRDLDIGMINVLTDFYWLKISLPNNQSKVIIKSILRFTQKHFYSNDKNFNDSPIEKAEVNMMIKSFHLISFLLGVDTSPITLSPKSVIVKKSEEINFNKEINERIKYFEEKLIERFISGFAEQDQENITNAILKDGIYDKFLYIIDNIPVNCDYLGFMNYLDDLEIKFNVKK